ncbi:MAG TPA: hypothetical protein VKQ30_19605 [Ktedonobacterales bacterium]|nr:hypothetical protein [Ktedonobacterales bacterium]
MPEHPRNHPHHHSAVERTEHEGAAPEPYPFIYSKDPLDERRFLRPGEGYGPAFAHGPSSGVLWILGIILAVIIGGGLISILVQAVMK